MAARWFDSPLVLDHVGGQVVKLVTVDEQADPGIRAFRVVENMHGIAELAF